MGITLEFRLQGVTPQAIMKSLLIVSALVGAFASIQAIKVGSESKVDSKSQWPYGSGYGMMGHGMMEDCMMCDSYHGCPSWCYGWNYPYQANVVISEKSDNKVAAQPAAEAKATSKWMYPYGYGYQRQCWMCDRYYGCPSWCYNGWNYPYQALSSVNDKSDVKWWYGNGNGMMRECMMCDMYYGCPSWCYGNWNYPYQALPAVGEKSEAKTDSKGKWWYGNGYGMMGHDMMDDCMMCDMYHECPSWCYNNWNYPYQALATVDDKTKTDSKGKWWYGNGYYGYQRECMMCGMYGCPSWCYRWNPWMRSN